MTNSFWVYVNEPHDKARVHQALCGHCNEGEGVAPERLASNGQWLGPFNMELAKHTALQSGKTNIRWCGHCARRLGIEQGLK